MREALAEDAAAEYLLYTATGHVSGCGGSASTPGQIIAPSGRSATHLHLQVVMYRF